MQHVQPLMSLRRANPACQRPPSAGGHSHHPPRSAAAVHAALPQPTPRAQQQPGSGRQQCKGSHSSVVLASRVKEKVGLNFACSRRRRCVKVACTKAQTSDM
jgi:hypothetical protein